MKGPHFLLVGLEKLGASTQKHQSTIVKYPDAGAEQQRFPDIMGDEQSRLAELSRRSRNCCCSSTRVTGSSAPNGSSNSNNGGSAASARATPTR